jgi:hypothetical protein
MIITYKPKERAEISIKIKNRDKYGIKRFSLSKIININ